MQLFYTPDLNSNDKEYVFSKDESRHIVKVLRKNRGDQLNITDGKGHSIEAIILDANDKKCRVAISKVSTREKSWNFELHIAIAPTKMMDRLEWFLEKTTEMGIDTISPIVCSRSERKNVKAERLERIITSAMKQSLKFTLPKLNELSSFQDFLEHTEFDEGYICHCLPDERLDLSSLRPDNKKVLIMIGPEGDFTESEIAMAKEKGLKALTLGKERLRTETAGILACAQLHLLDQIH